MTRVNLLPWRELRRKAVNRQVRNFAIGVAILMGVIVWGAYMHMNARIDYQNERNSYLKAEIKKVEKELKEINQIKKKKAQLIARMEVIQKLQKDRARMVRNFDDLARNLPKGMHLTQLSIKGRNVTIKGAADSNGTISKFMRQIESSEQFTTPNLNIINVKPAGGLRVSRFTMKFRIKVNKSPVENNKAKGQNVAAKNNKGGK
jgi:type IV pilus assembly protein PilN